MLHKKHLSHSALADLPHNFVGAKHRAGRKSVRGRAVIIKPGFVALRSHKKSKGQRQR
jgi:hypothetical protein